jgi:hypothetical protein
VEGSQVTGVHALEENTGTMGHPISLFLLQRQNEVDSFDPPNSSQHNDLPHHSPKGKRSSLTATRS